MTIDEGLAVIGEQLEGILEENEDAISWDTENDIKYNIINKNELEEIFDDQDAIEDMYTYELFENESLSFEKKVGMIQTWISSLEEEADIEIDLDISLLKVEEV